MIPNSYRGPVQLGSGGQAWLLADHKRTYRLTATHEMTPRKDGGMSEWETLEQMFERIHACHDCDPGPCLCACGCQNSMGCREVLGPYCTSCHMNIVREREGNCAWSEVPHE